MNGDRTESREEEDLPEWSTKKVKGGEHNFTKDSTVPISYADIYDDSDNGEQVKRSYKETILGDHSNGAQEEGRDGSGT